MVAPKPPVACGMYAMLFGHIALWVKRFRHLQVPQSYIERIELVPDVDSSRLGIKVFGGGNAANTPLTAVRSWIPRIQNLVLHAP